MMMSQVALLLGLLAAIVIIAGLLRALLPRAAIHDRPWPLEAKRRLLTERERELYERLVRALPDHIVLTQVQLLQLVKFKRGRRPYAIFNRVSQLSLDFVILRADTSVIAAIELDEASHDRAERCRADGNKTHALKSAGIPLIRWSAKALPDAAAIQAALASAPTDAR
jgi:hypothetical protein